MRLTLKSIIILLSLSIPGICGISGTIAFSKLINHSDQIVVATLESTSTASGEPTIELLIHRKIKGSLKPLQTIVASLPKEVYAYSKILPSLVNKSGIWFLNTTATNSYVLPTVTGDVFPTNLFIEVPENDLPDKYSYADDADPRAKVFFEFEAAALDPRTSDTVLKLLTWRMLDDAMGVELRQAFFKEIAASSSPTLQMAGLAGQIRSGQQGSVAALAKAPIDGIRYDAVIGIAQFAMNFPLTTAEQKHTVMSTFRPDASVTDEMRRNYPAMDVFHRNEQQYIMYWKTWLSNHPIK